VEQRRLEQGAAVTKFIRGIAINPELPPGFDCTPNQLRPASHMRWWGRAYIETYTMRRLKPNCTEADLQEWLIRYESWWPDGVHYDVRRLDGGAHDRPTFLGAFTSLKEALACALGATRCT
jgi:hypothetical protein